MIVHPSPLLRPPVELTAAVVFIAVATAFFIFPQQLNLSWIQGIVLSAICATLGSRRLLQTLRVWRYRRLLTNRKPYVIKEIPNDQKQINKGLFLGRGFQWSQPHVQRLKETRMPAALKYLGKAGDQGGDPVLHGVGLLEGEQEVWMSLSERFGHILTLGATRVGKTRLAEVLIGQDIHRGDAVIVLDPKGDLDLLRRVYHEAEKSGKLALLRIFHLRYPSVSEHYNPIASYDSPGEIATRITEQLPSKGSSEAFKQFAWRFLNTIISALDALGETPNYRIIYKHVTDIEPLFNAYHDKLFTQHAEGDYWRVDVDSRVKKLMPKKSEQDKSEQDKPKQPNPKQPRHRIETRARIEYRENMRIEDDLASEIQHIMDYDPVYYDKLIASLLPLLNKLKSGRTSAILVPAENSKEENTISWDEAIAKKQIVYVGLDSLANPAIARAVGNTMFADLAASAGKLYAAIEGSSAPKHRICIHVDEFNDIVGPHLHPMLSKSGGAGVQITAYTQTLADIEASLDGDRAAAARLVGNFNSLIMLRVRTLDTARTLVEQVPNFDVTDLAESSSVADSSQAESPVSFTSSLSARVAVRSVHGIEASDLMRLPKGEAFALLDGGSIWKLRFPLIGDLPACRPANEMEDATIGGNVERQYSVVEIMTKVRQLRQNHATRKAPATSKAPT